ncbi:expressed unknown protein [Seminavis robusta]|uniref:Uncharacterized protein n=1 Tax=Seminavis robusta TaxID=568900 RepID=A0A9N8E7I3_9STRA|nr:expressed unknown protein [Seminavis robusta]|eukprot:Sro631_g178410.1 n/a (185) ;mRNA; r:7924-8572
MQKTRSRQAQISDSSNGKAPQQQNQKWYLNLIGMIGAVRFSVVESKEEGSKAIGWDEERNRAKRGCADRNERKRVKKERKGAMAAEQERIRGLGPPIPCLPCGFRPASYGRPPIRERVVAGILEEWIGQETLQDCIDAFRQRFITPGNNVDLADWDTVQRLQQIMIQFMVKNLFEDPVPGICRR